MTRPLHPRQALTDQRGFALVVVVVVLLLVSFLASQLILQVRAEQQVALNARHRIAASFLAEAGVNLALFRLLDKPVDENPDFAALRLGLDYETHLHTGTVSYAAFSESGKIDLNGASAGLLSLFFEYHGMTPEDAAVVTDSLQDWRDPDDLLRVNGAEKAVYESLPQPYIPRNGTIGEAAEFFLIHGTAKLAGKFAPEEVFTVHNPQGRINCNSLTPAMLAFLANGEEERIEAYREAQYTYPLLNEALVRQLLGDARFTALKPYLDFAAPPAGGYYSITAIGHPAPDEGQEKSRAGVRVEVLVQRSNNSYQFLAWREQNV